MGTNKNTKEATRLPLYIAIAICVGVFIGANMSGSFAIANSSNLTKSLYKLRQIFTYIENDYVDEADSHKLVEGAITKIFEDLDPHTLYIPAKDHELTQSRLEGNYEGIGIEFNIFKDTIHVVSPLSGGPSQKLGINTGDKIIKIDGVNVAGMGITNRKVVEMLRGPDGSKVIVSIKKAGENKLIDFTIKRDVIPQYSVDVSYMVGDGIGYIKIARFASSTYNEFKTALLKLKDQGMEKLIIDLTGNPGGYLNRSVQIVDELLAGKQMIVYIDGKNPKYTEEHYSGKEGDFEKGPLVIMIDEGSVSASEIVAGAIQDHDRGLIVGRRSYGKGLVQLPFDLNDGSELRLTISRYYTPSGRSIQKMYEGGKLNEYHMEAFNRHESGELYNSDSIKFNDSLVYKTDKGRIVYGGGGITPDFFVPLDSTRGSSFLNQIFSSNSIQEYTLKYIQENKAELIKMGREEFLTSFQVSDAMLQDLITQAESNQLTFDEHGFSRSKKFIKLLTKAYIGRTVWGNDVFYPIYNQQNEIFNSALQLMDEADKITK